MHTHRGMHTGTHTCTHMYVHTHAHETCPHMHMRHAHTCTRGTHTHMRMRHAHAHTHAHEARTRTHMYIRHAHARTHAHEACTHAHTCMLTHVHTHAQTCMHTHLFLTLGSLTSCKSSGLHGRNEKRDVCVYQNSPVVRGVGFGIGDSSYPSRQAPDCAGLGPPVSAHGLPPQCSCNSRSPPSIVPPGEEGPLTAPLSPGPALLEG